MSARLDGLQVTSVRPGWPDDAVGAVGDLLMRVADLRRENEQLRIALASRVVIEQAKGMLAERHQLAPEQTFEVLRRAARANGRRLHDLAEEVLRSSHTPREILRQLERRR
jgi:hypothetical protein